MIGRPASVRTQDGMDDPLRDGPLVVGYQIMRQDQLPHIDDLVSDDAVSRNSFCQQLPSDRQALPRFRTKLYKIQHGNGEISA